MKRKTLFAMLLFLLIAFVPLNADAKVKLNASKKSLTINQTYQLKAKGTKKKVRWSSANSYIASVTKKGKIKGKHAGQTYVIATVGGQNYYCKVTVIAPSINTSMKLTKGQKMKIGISNRSKFSKITYKSSNKNVATVSSKGVVTGKKDGTTTIKVCFNKVYTVKVTVKVEYLYTASTVSIMRGSHKTLTPAHLGTGGSYRVSNPAMGYVSNGVYYSKDYGVNVVTYTRGSFRHTFTVKNYCWEAHRGYSKVYPDNTLEAIQAAKDAGADSVELDVRSSRDGVFVLSHDSDLTNSTNGKLNDNVRNYYITTLQRENIIYKNGVYYHMPTLEEALTLCKKLGLNASIEMKTLPSIGKYFEIEKPELTRRLLSDVKTYGNSMTSIIVTSAENAKLLAENSDGSVKIRVTNDAYASKADLRAIADKYSFIMPTSQFANLYYKGYLLTTDNPF